MFESYDTMPFKKIVMTILLLFTGIPYFYVASELGRQAIGQYRSVDGYAFWAYAGVAAVLAVVAVMSTVTAVLPKRRLPGYLVVLQAGVLVLFVVIMRA